MADLVPRRFILGLSACIASSTAVSAQTTQPIIVASPDGRIKVEIRLDNKGSPTFNVSFQDSPIANGMLGLAFAGSGPLGDGMKVIGTTRTSRDETYAIPVGKASSALDRRNEAVVSLEEVRPPHR